MSERCSDLSRAAGVPLSASATTAETWLLLEVAGSWPSDVAAAGGLLDEAHEAVAAWLVATPRSRLQYIRRPGRSSSDRSLAFVVRAKERGGEVRRIELADQAYLARVDLDTAGEPVDGSLVLVCGHGSRDACCALKGTAVFGALAERLGEEELWISSHQGGHRFAANVLVLPAGLHFGRVEPGEAPFVVARALAKKIELDRYRGRTCFEPIVQAAEQAVREATGLDGVFELELAKVEGSTVRFRSWEGAEHTAIVAEVAGPVAPASCGADPESQRVLRARVV